MGLVTRAVVLGITALESRHIRTNRLVSLWTVFNYATDCIVSLEKTKSLICVRKVTRNPNNPTVKNAIMVCSYKGIIFLDTLSFQDRPHVVIRICSKIWASSEDSISRARLETRDFPPHQVGGCPACFSVDRRQECNKESDLFMC